MFDNIKEEKLAFLDNLIILQGSGINILESLHSISEEVSSKRMKKALDVIIKNLSEGSSLWKAIEFSKVFSSYEVALIRAGENSGNLTENIKILIETSKRERSFSSKVKSAMMYPLFVLAIAVVVAVGALWFILPGITNVFSSMKMDLPLVTKILISIGSFLGDYGMIVIPTLLLLFIFIVYFIFFYEKTKHIGQTILFLIPPVRRMIMAMEISRFGFMSHNLFKSGIPITDTMDYLTDIASFKIYKDFYQFLKIEILKGNSFKNAFNNYKHAEKIFPLSVQRLIFSSEKSGKLSEAMREVGVFYEEKNEEYTKNLSVFIEPVLLFLVWIFVLFLAISIILPIYNLIGNIQS